MTSLSETGQHDDHCRLVFDGEEYWIVAVRGPYIGLTNERRKCVLDASRIDWIRYTARAAEMIDEKEMAL